MFIRKSINKAGNTSVQIVEKDGRLNRLVKHIGTARNPLELDELLKSASWFIEQERIKSGKVSLFDNRFKRSDFDALLDSLSFPKVLDSPTYQFFKYFYQKVGFNSLDNECFKDLVIARIVEPGSKRKTREILITRFGKKYSLTKIYRTLKTATAENYKAEIEKIVNVFVRKNIDPEIAVLFFDVTTLYYEAFEEDDFRRFGFSKDLKHNQPQIVVGLTVTRLGVPLSLNVFEGNRFEGHTMLPCVNSLVRSFNLKDFVVVADSAMLSVENLAVLEKQNLKYIVGARIGNLPTKLFKELLEKAPQKDGETIRITIKTDPKRVLIVSYSAKRATKDRYGREKLLTTAIKAQANPSVITRRYKFLVAKAGKLELKNALIEKSISLEGLKGYITNHTALTNDEVIQKYGELWQVEKSFRMSKSDLLARPIFHTLKESIEAHLLIVFTALVVSSYIEIITQKSIRKVVKTLLQIKEIVIEEKTTSQKSSRFTNSSEEVQKLLKLAKLTWVT